MLGSSLMFVLLGHQLLLDMSLTLYMTLTFVGFCNAQGAARWRRWMLLSWAGISGAHDQGTDCRGPADIRLDCLYRAAAGSDAVAAAPASARRVIVRGSVFCRG